MPNNCYANRSLNDIHIYCSKPKQATLKRYIDSQLLHSNGMAYISTYVRYSNFKCADK